MASTWVARALEQGLSDVGLARTVQRRARDAGRFASAPCSHARPRTGEAGSVTLTPHIHLRRSWIGQPQRCAGRSVASRPVASGGTERLRRSVEASADRVPRLRRCQPTAATPHTFCTASNGRPRLLPAPHGRASVGLENSGTAQHAAHRPHAHPAAWCGRTSGVRCDRSTAGDGSARFSRADAAAAPARVACLGSDPSRTTKRAPRRRPPPHRRPAGSAPGADGRRRHRCRPKARKGCRP